MDNVQEFLTRLTKEKNADALQRSTFNTDESSIDALLGLDKHKMNVKGKAAEYKRLLSTCKFKIALYFTYDKWNRPYTTDEKKERLHRRYVPSLDKINGIVDEKKAYDVLIDYCMRKYDRLDAAQIYLIDRHNGLEHYIFRFDARVIMNSECTPLEFKTHEITGGTFFNKFIDEPIRSEPIKFYK